MKLVLPHWKLDKTPPPEERKEEVTLETKKDREKERKSTKSVKGLKADDVERESKTREAKDKDKGIIHSEIKYTVKIHGQTLCAILLAIRFQRVCVHLCNNVVTKV